MIFLQIPFLSPLVWLRDIARLSFVNLVGMVLTVFTVCYIVVNESIILAEDGAQEVDILFISS